jgi:hypothetical protein
VAVIETPPPPITSISVLGELGLWIYQLPEEGLSTVHCQLDTALVEEAFIDQV